MSITHGDAKLEIFYIGLQKRQHPTKDETSEFVYTITKDHNEYYGKPFITLNAQSTYKFVINTPGHPFYITTNAVGGGVLNKPVQSLLGAISIISESVMEKGNVGIEKGELTWTPSREHAQMKLYYQSNFGRYMGNEIIVRLVD